MIKRIDILDIINFKRPGTNLSINLETFEVIDNPDNFVMPSDSTLYRWASDYDAHVETENRQKDRVLNELAQVIGVNMTDEELTTEQIKAKIREALK